MLLEMMNAAGTARWPEDVRRLSQVDALTEITVGSFTPAAQPGNGGRDHYFESGAMSRGGINALGMPNGGLAFMNTHLHECVDIARRHGKRLRVSIAADSLEGLSVLATAAYGACVSTIELNLGCPNVWNDGKQKAIWSFSPERVKTAILAARKNCRDVNIAVKLSPISDPGRLAKVLAAIAEVHESVQEVVCSNTFPNGYLYDFEAGQDAISAGGGLGGVSGPFMLAIAAGQVFQARRALPETITVTGVGGITNGNALATHLKAGAHAVQIGTHYYRFRLLNIFSDILQEFALLHPNIAQQYADVQ